MTNEPVLGLMRQHQRGGHRKDVSQWLTEEIVQFDGLAAPAPAHRWPLSTAKDFFSVVVLCLLF